MNKVVVADAGPLIALARLHLLELLPHVFGKVLVTDVVLGECASSPDFPEALTIQAAMTNKVMTRCVAPDFSAFMQEIDIGEASAIAVAVEWPGISVSLWLEQLASWYLRSERAW